MAENGANHFFLNFWVCLFNLINFDLQDSDKDWQIYGQKEKCTDKIRELKLDTSYYLIGKADTFRVS